MKRMFFAALVSAAITVPGVVSAAVINLAAGERLCEASGARLLPGTICDQSIGDLGQNPTTLINAAADFTLDGYIQDLNGSLYADAATFDLPAFSTLTLSLTGWSEFFDADVLLTDAASQVVYAGVISSNMPSLLLGTGLDGLYALKINAAGGTDGNRVTANWRLTNEVGEVPTPSALALLSLGLVGMMSVRRRA